MSGTTYCQTCLRHTSLPSRDVCVLCDQKLPEADHKNQLIIQLQAECDRMAASNDYLTKCGRGAIEAGEAIIHELREEREKYRELLVQTRAQWIHSVHAPEILEALKWAPLNRSSESGDKNGL